MNLKYQSLKIYYFNSHRYIDKTNITRFQKLITSSEIQLIGAIKEIKEIGIVQKKTCS